MILRALCLLIVILALSSAVGATDAPEIELRSDSGLGDYAAEGLKLEYLGVVIDVRAGIAQVSLNATLRNETDEDAEARFNYPLPDGSIINGYALDLDGTLVDGVLMPKERAETLYTDRVTASVDPGIAARTTDNRYQTRIYPIAANGGRRTIQLDFAVPVTTGGLKLPVSQRQSVETVFIKITGDGALAARSPLEGTQAKNVTLSGEIFIPAVAAGPSLSTHAQQRFLTLPLASQNAAKAEDVSSVAVIWDTSLSRVSVALAAERLFVNEVLARLAPQTQSLIHGADEVDFAASYKTPAQLDAALTRLRYDGATNLSALLADDALSRADIQSDICLVITDGRSTLGNGGLPNLPCRVFTFSADKNPNTDWLALLAKRNAGANLTGLGAAEAARQITTGGGPQLAAGQKGEIISAGQRHWFILPVSDDARAVTIKFNTETKRINLRKLDMVSHPATGAIWGQRRITELRTRGPQGFDTVVAASRRWNVQAQEVAFLVLEEGRDYIEAKIDPPKSFPADRLETYKADLAEARADEAEERADHLDELRDEWEDQIEWWEMNWDEKPNSKSRTSVSQPQSIIAPPPQTNMACWDGTVTTDASACPAQPAPLMEAPVEAESLADFGADEVIVTGARRSNPAGELPPAITIQTRAWSPERPFLTALADLGSSAFEIEYIAQRKTHGDRPSFYLEVADQLHRKGQTDRAARMAATALDLKSATPVTRTNVADRLLMYGNTEDAIALYRDVLPASQDRPQPFYNIALALIQAGDGAAGDDRNVYYREAFEHLIHIINSPWEDDYEGIHLIALQDLNRTLARLPKRARRKFQKELALDEIYYKNLPIDIRILIDWTSDDADLDIHVIERVGAEDEETAYYSNPATRRGGRVSNDMTEGYGPEEYMIRRAPNGLYRAESDYFAQDNYGEDGALKLRARLWRNFGRKDETYQTVIIEMLEDKEDAYILGEIQVGPRPETDGTVAVEPETE